MEYKSRLIIISVALLCLLPAVALSDYCLKALYIDGNLIGEANVPDSGLTWGYDRLTIGSEGNREDMYNEYVGKLDEFAIYQGVMDANTVAAHYAAGSSYASYSAAVSASNPLLWLKLDEDDVNDGQQAVNSGSVSVNGTYTALGLNALMSPTAGFVAGSDAVQFNVNGPLDAEDGTCVDVPDSSEALSRDTGGDISIEFWANYNDANFPRFFQHNNSWATGVGAYGLIANDANTFNVLGAGVSNNMTIPTEMNDINDSNWHHFVVTYDSNYLEYEEANYPDVVMEDNPVLYLRFESDDPCDSSGNNYWVEYGDAVTIEAAPGSYGNCALLGGSFVTAANQQTEPCLPVDANHSYAFAPNDICVEFWLYTPEPETVDGYGTLFLQSTDIMDAPGASRATTGGRVRFGDNRASGDGLAYCPNAWKNDDTNWHHYIIGLDTTEDANGPVSTRVIWYTDGDNYKNQTYDTTVAKGYLGPEMDHLMIGSEPNRFDQEGAAIYAGYIDEFAIYDHILTTDRIRAHRKAFYANTCEEMWARQLVPVQAPWAEAVDKNQDCRIDFIDFASFALDWMLCNEPAGGTGCVDTW